MDEGRKTEDEKEEEARTLVRLGRAGTRPLSALEALAKYRHLVLLGDPGGGKSTFVNHLALCLAGHALRPDVVWTQRLSDLPPEWLSLLPVPVVLRELAAWFKTQTHPPQKTGLLLGYLHHWLAENGLDKFYDFLCEVLDRGEALLLLDGLDEVPTGGNLRRQALEMIAAQSSRPLPILVTCRVLSYKDPRWQLDGSRWHSTTLARLNKEQIEHFISAWYAQLARLKPGTNADVLSSKLRHALTSRPDLWRMADNPLLLTVMALVHTHKGELPDARVLLYEEAVNYLLWQWEAIKIHDQEDKQTDFRQLLNDQHLSDIDLKKALWELAYSTHEQVKTAGDEATADIPEARLLKALRALIRDPDEGRKWADEMVQIMKLRGGLLVENTPEVYSLPHRTFQEYLAACYISSQANFSDHALDLAKADTFWWEVIRLAIGRLVHSGNTDQPFGLLHKLCPRNPPSDEAGWRKVWLAGQCLLEVGLERAGRDPVGAEHIKQVRGHLIELAEGGHLPAAQRAAAADVLARLGDTRPGVGVGSDGLPDIAWCHVPAGPFLMGNGKTRFTCRLITQPYRISRYPVTVAQYATFVAARGYQDKDLWTPQGWDWRNWHGIDGPLYLDEPFNTSNHPQVGVSWYEAVAFCTWLGQQPSFQGASLPTEAQWERVARHTDGRIYPWGRDKLDAHCNIREIGIGSTSAVGIFPSGKAMCDAHDLAGNVWEWCRTAWLDSYDDYEKKVEGRDNLSIGGAHIRRVLRGGAFNLSAVDVPRATRSNNAPDYRLNKVGFRVVLPGTL